MPKIPHIIYIIIALLFFSCMPKTCDYYCTTSILACFRRVIRFPSSAIRLCVHNSMRRSESMRRIWIIFCMKLTYNSATKIHISNFQKSNMDAIMVIIIDNLQLKYRKVYAGRNLWGRYFSFSAWSLPIMVQQKLIF